MFEIANHRVFQVDGGLLVPYDAHGLLVVFRLGPEHAQVVFERKFSHGTVFTDRSIFELVGIRGEPTGVASEFRGDVIATAKRALEAGEILDGEGGYTVTGGLRPGKASIAAGYLPLGLAHDVKLRKSIPDGAPITWSDVEIDE